MTSEAANLGEEPWITQFDDEINDLDEGAWEIDIARVLKQFLLSDGHSSTDTARRIDDSYEQQFLPSDPLMKFKDDQGMEGFLSCFYEVVFTLARLIPYHSSMQEKLIELILELRKLPPRPSKIWKEDCVVWTREPIFVMQMEENWNRSYVSDCVQGSSRNSLQKLCSEWVNLSSFFARCLAAGLLDQYDDRCKHPSIDIPHGLERDLPHGPKRDAKVMVAVQYVLLAGRTVAEDCFTKPVDGFGPD